MEITGLQFFTLAAIGIAVVVHLIWRSEVVERMRQGAKDWEDEEKAEHDERERHRMVHEVDSRPASMEPFCGGGKKP